MIVMASATLWPIPRCSIGADHASACGKSAGLERRIVEWMSILRCPSCGTANRVAPTPKGTPRCAKCKTMLPWLVEADTASFDAEASASVPVVVDLWAPWCGPCRMIAPVLEQLAARHAGRLKVVKVNVDDEPALGSRFDARSIPLLVVLEDGREVDRIVGALPPAALESRLAPRLV
jgi:thioredoxin 2